MSIQKTGRLPVKFIVLLVFIGAAATAWFYVRGIQMRFPDLNLENASIGVASWYSRTDPNINEHTANGEVFDDNEHTCASWDFPFDQHLLVINAFTGRYIDCRVNDRGPAKRLNRKIDLSKAAFSKIANVKRGLINVFIIPIVDEASLYADTVLPE